MKFTVDDYTAITLQFPIYFINDLTLSIETNDTLGLTYNVTYGQDLLSLIPYYYIITVGKNNTFDIELYTKHKIYNPFTIYNIIYRQKIINSTFNCSFNR